MFRQWKTLTLLPLAATFTLPGLAVANEPVRLEPITVTSPRLARDLRDTPAAVGVVDEEQLQQGRQGLQLDESLNRVPGVFFQNRYNFAQNLRLSIRGFGARAPFGVRGIRILVDGIPETLPDGQSQVDGIDLESAQSVEVLRGPSSALYGNASGGVVAITTMDGPPEPYIEARGTIGSYGFTRYGVKAGGQSGPWNAHVSAWDLSYDGYRDQSRTDKKLLNAKVRYDFDADRSLTAVLTALDQPVGQDAGGLNRAQVRDNRRQAAANALILDAGQEVEQQRIGLIFRDAASLPGELSARVFYTNREFSQQLPFPGPSLVAFDRDYYGFGLDYTDRYSFLGLPSTYIVGVESARQSDDRERFVISGQGVQLAQRQDAKEEATNVGLFGQTDISLTNRLNLTLGGRYDEVRFKITDRTDGGEGSGSKRFTEVSATTGLAFQLRPDHQVYANVGTAFETPTFTEFYNPNAPAEAFSADLDPQKAINYEIGFKGFLGDRTQYDIAFFRVDTRDEVIQTGFEPNVFENAGRSRRDGIELGVEHFVTPRFSLSGAYTWSDFKFRRFRDVTGEEFRGNRLPGLPEHTLFAEAAYRDPNGSFLIVDTLIVSRIQANNQNDEQAAGYGLINVRVGTEQRLGSINLETFVAVNNITNKEYIGNVRINSNNTTVRNYYEPAPERNVFAGVRARF